MRWTVLALRRLRDDRAATIGLVVLVLVTALIAAAAPRVLAGLSDQAVRGEIGAATAGSRNLVVMQQRRIAVGPDGDPLAVIREAGDALDRTFPSRIRPLVVSRDIVVESGRFRVGGPTTDPAFVRLRIQEGVEPHLRYLEGRPPTSAVEVRDGVGLGRRERAPVYETAVSTLTAQRFEIVLGGVVALSGDPNDPLIGRALGPIYAFARITGIYEVPDPGSDFWLDDPLLIHPMIRALSPETQLLDAALLIAPETYPALLANTPDFGPSLRYTWRSFLDTGRITGRAVPPLIEDFRRLRVAYPSANVTTADETALRTGLPAILEGHQAWWTAAESILAVLALGPALVTVATLALIAALASRRRRASLALARSRGASAAQVLGPTFAEGALVAVPAALGGAAVVVLLVPTGRLVLTAGAAALVAAVAIGVVVATVVPVAREQGTARRPGDRVITGVGGRRLVAELLIVGMAVVGAWLLRERGVQVSGSAGEVVGFDPLIAAVPSLVGVAAGIVAIRVYPLVMRAAASVGRRSRGLVPMLAARRATEGGASAVVLLVLMATATVGSFAAVSLDNLARGSELAAWQRTGAAYRIEAPTGALPSAFDPAAIPGADAVATVFQASVPVNLTGPQVLVTVPEAGALSAVLAGSPIDPAFPAGFATPGDGPIPAIVSRSLVNSPRGVEEDGTFTLSVEGYALQYRVMEVRDAYPGIP